jgi:hypothetical protein
MVSQFRRSVTIRLAALERIDRQGTTRAVRCGGCAVERNQGRAVGALQWSAAHRLSEKFVLLTQYRNIVLSWPN